MWFWIGFPCKVWRFHRAPFPYSWDMIRNGRKHHNPSGFSRCASISHYHKDLGALHVFIHAVAYCLKFINLRDDSWTYVGATRWPSSDKIFEILSLYGVHPAIPSTFRWPRACGINLTAALAWTCIFDSFCVFCGTLNMFLVLIHSVNRGISGRSLMIFIIDVWTNRAVVKCCLKRQHRHRLHRK